MSEQDKACPFCGCTTINYDGDALLKWKVCDWCGAEGPAETPNSDPPQGWNIRTADLAQAPAPVRQDCPYGLNSDECCGGYCGMDEQHTGRPAEAALEAPDAGVVAELVEALRLADAALSGANMNMAAVEKKVKAALSLIAHNTTEG